MTGDSRSGQQQLDDAEADYHLTIQAMARSEEGRVLFDELELRMEALLVTLRGLSVEMGCSAETEGSVQSSVTPSAESMVVHRPLAYNVRSYRFDTENQAVALLTRQWANEAVRRLWNLGHPAQFLVRVFNAIPPSLVSAIGTASKVLQMIKQRSMQTSLALQCLMEDHDISPAGTSAEVTIQMGADERSIRDEDGSRGFLSLDWDTRT